MLVVDGGLESSCVKSMISLVFDDMTGRLMSKPSPIRRRCRGGLRDEDDATVEDDPDSRFEVVIVEAEVLDAFASSRPLI